MTVLGRKNKLFLSFPLLSAVAWALRIKLTKDRVTGQKPKVNKRLFTDAALTHLGENQ